MFKSTQSITYEEMNKENINNQEKKDTKIEDNMKSLSNLSITSVSSRVNTS